MVHRSAWNGRSLVLPVHFREHDRMANRLPSFSRLLDLPENHSALVAVQDLAAKLGCDRESADPNPLYLYGPAGSGKTCLSKALQAEVLRHRGQAVIGWLSA